MKHVVFLSHKNSVNKLKSTAMAEKELTVFIVDVGAAMGAVHNGTTDLEVGLQYIRNEFITKIFRERKTDLVSLLTVEDDVTMNDKDLDGVAERMGIKMPSYDDLKLLNRTLTAVESSPETAGIVRALLSTFQTIAAFVGKKKFIKNVVLLTNSVSVPELNEEFRSAIRHLITDQAVNVTLLGVDFNDENIDKDHARILNREAWMALLQGLPGSRIMHSSAIDEYLSTPKPKLVRPVKVFNGDLRIGADLTDSRFDPHLDISCVCIGVEGYPGVKSAKPPTRKTFGLNSQGDPVSISNITEYHIRKYATQRDGKEDVDEQNDEDTEREFEIQMVDRSELIRAYKYGSSTVVLPEALEQQRVYQTEPGLDVVQVISRDRLPRWYLQSETILIMGRSNSIPEIQAVAAIVDSLAELDAVAIARYVSKTNAEVQMCALLPVYLKRDSHKRKSGDDELGDMRALALSRIPFMEDEKMAAFPDLTRLKTTSGRDVVGAHKLIPDDDVLEKMDELVTLMDLDQLGAKETDFDGEKRVFNQMMPDGTMDNQDILVKRSVGIRRVDHMLKDAVSKSSKISGGLKEYCSTEKIVPSLPDGILRDMEPHPLIIERGESTLRSLSELLNVSKVDKTKFARRRKETDEIVLQEEGEDDLSLEALLRRGVRE